MNYFLAIGIFIVLMAGFKFYMKQVEKNENRANTKVYATQYGKLFIKDHPQGIEVRHEDGRRVIIEGIKLSEINQSLANSIIITRF